MPKKKKQNNEEHISKEDKIESILNTVSKKYDTRLGLMKASDLKQTFIPTGIDIFDRYMGGIPEGGMSLIYGPYSAGKSTIAALTVANAQRMGKVCVWVDAEGSLSSEYLESLGVDLDKLYVLRGDTLETNADTLVNLIIENAVDFIVYDSIAAVASQQEKYSKSGQIKELTESTVALIARVMSSLHRRIATDIARNKITMIFLSQVRADLQLTSLMSGVTAQGGVSIKHHSLLILRLFRSHAKDNIIKDDEGLLQWKVKIIVEKNKINGVEGKEFELIWDRQQGPNNMLSTIELAKKANVIISKGAWYLYYDIKEQGWKTFVEKIMENKDVYDKIVNDIYNTNTEEIKEIPDE